ncbi:hypothetical protein GALMADRAFT_255943 [Galerina marginata CBS 339.88]|uniref:Uncharacterized protein n=1 Tax=Galerina marginata (strain CBS 339.88) TaxID=685588 RepID=A0A067SHK2_GALM3|nr:hypothetical protein GALMADRAFT_255943 [Galerina marginata CBS 339.88]
MIKLSRSSFASRRSGQFAGRSLLLYSSSPNPAHTSVPNDQGVLHWCLRGGRWPMLLVVELGFPIHHQRLGRCEEITYVAVTLPGSFASRR